MVSFEQELERFADGSQFCAVQVALAVGGRETRGVKQEVAFTKRHVEYVGDLHDHLAAGFRSTGLQELTCRVETSARTAS